jgi:hypothetical protein
MAAYANTDCGIEVNSVDLSDRVVSASFNETADDLETTAFGQGNRSRIGGLTDGSISIEFLQDFAATETYATLAAAGLGSVIDVAFTPVAADAVAATNPKKTVPVVVTEIPFLDGQVGEVSTVTVTWPFAGAVTTATA